MTHFDPSAAGRYSRRNSIFSFAISACLFGANVASAAGAASANLSLLPLNFEANIGQVESSQVQYLAHGKSYGIELTKQGAILALASAHASAADVIRLQLLGSASAVSPIAEQPLPGKINYFIGNDPLQWRTGVETFGKIRYSAVYPGVDLIYYGNQGHLEYDFDVAAGADPSKIGVRFQGAKKLHLAANGDLAIETHGRQITFERPVAYQWDGAERIPVAATYRLSGKSMRFALGAYDHSKTLIIDPVLSYFSYLGGSNEEYLGNEYGYYFTDQAGMNPAALDPNKNLYVVGQTQSTDFPTKNPFAAPTTKTGRSDGWAFITSISPDATTLNYSTYLGGSVNDAAASIAVDSSGNAFVVGTTTSNDFPILGGYQSICGPNLNNTGNHVEPGCQYGADSAWVARLNVSGALVASTFLGGSATQTQGNAIAIDSADRVYIVGDTIPGQTIPTGTGFTPSLAFPVTSGALVSPPPFSSANDDISEQPYDAFVAVFSSNLSTLLYSTLYGDTQVYNPNQYEYLGSTYGNGIALDATGNIYMLATTSDGFLPTTAGAYQPTNPSCDPYQSGDTNNQGTCGLVVKLSPVTTASGGAAVPTQIYSTYLGGYPTGSYAVLSMSGIAVDSSGDAYVLGFTNTAGFPTTAGTFQQSCNTPNDTDCSSAVIAKLNPSGSALLASTFYGCATCSADDVYGTNALTLDSSGNVYITGWSANSIPQVNSLSAGTPGGVSPFVAKFNPSLTTLLFATVLNTGGAQNGNTGGGVAVDSTGNIYLAGSTNTTGGSSTATAGVFQPALGGDWDGWVAKISNVIVSTSTTLTLSPNSAAAGASVSFTALVKPATGSNVPTGSVTFKNGSTTLGSATLNGTGQATFSTASLAIGSYSVTAAYGGDSGDIASTSASATLTITAPVVATTTMLAATPTSATTGTAVVFTASVAPATGTGVPTGSVTFKSGSMTLGSVSLTGGKATFTDSTLAVGSYSVTAVYGGDSGDTGSTSNAVTVSIAAPVLATTTTLAVSPTSTTPGTAVSFTATVVPASGSNVPSGTVTFKNGATSLGSATLSGGKANFSDSALTAGNYSITASYGGDTDDDPSTSSTVTLTITTAIAAPPTGVTATAGNGQVKLAWTASSGAVSYDVYQGSASGAESTTPVQTGITATTATITGLTNGTAYFFTVAAVDAGGTSAPSAEVSASPLAPSSGGSHGGGGLGLSTLLALLLLAALRFIDPRGMLRRS